jgi:hypothetical protein
VIEQPGKWEGLVRLDDNKPNLRKRKRTHNIEICGCRTRCSDLCPNRIVKVVCTEEFCGLVNCGNHYDAKFGAVIQIDDHTKFGNGVFAVEPISVYVPILVCFAYSFSPANHLWFHSVGRSRLLKSTKSKENSTLLRNGAQPQVCKYSLCLDSKLTIRRLSIPPLKEASHDLSTIHAHPIAKCTHGPKMDKISCW